MSIENDKRVQAFLEIACGKIRSRADRKKIRSELIDHLYEALEHGRSIEEALLTLGDPAEMAAPFAQIHRPYYLTSAFYAVCLLAIIVLTVSGTGTIARMYLNRVEHDTQAIVDTYKEKFLEDQRILSREAVFAIAGTKSDAGPYLNPLVEWQLSYLKAAGREQYAFLKQPATITLSDATRTVLKQNRHSIAQLVESGVDKGFNLAWMQKLSRFDHWDLFAWQPMNQLLSVPSKVSWFTAPLPNVEMMLMFAQLRLARGLRTGDMKPALVETRQLARLVYTNETMIGSMMSVAILATEREAYEEAIKRNIIQAADWKPLSKEVAIRARRAMFGYAELFQFGNSDETIDKVLSGQFGYAGYCAALSESAVSIMILRDRSLDSMPLEVDLKPQIKRYDVIFEESRRPCRLTYTRALYNHLGATKAWFKDYSHVKVDGPTLSGRIFTSETIARLPWVRQLAIYGLAWGGTSDYMSGPYTNNALPPVRK